MTLFRTVLMGGLAVALSCGVAEAQPAVASGQDDHLANAGDSGPGPRHP